MKLALIIKFGVGVKEMKINESIHVLYFIYLFIFHGVHDVLWKKKMEKEYMQIRIVLFFSDFWFEMKQVSKYLTEVVSTDDCELLGVFGKQMFAVL